LFSTHPTIGLNIPGGKRGRSEKKYAPRCWQGITRRGKNNVIGPGKHYGKRHFHQCGYVGWEQTQGEGVKFLP